MSDEAITINEDSLPMLYKHCANVYSMMLQQSSYDDARGCQVWEGVLTHLITRECNLSLPFYSSVTRALKAMNCVRQIRRGGGTTPSMWELVQAPTPMNYYQSEASGKFEAAKSQSRPSRVASVEQNLRQLVSRVDTLEDALQGLIELIIKGENEDAQETSD